MFNGQEGEEEMLIHFMVLELVSKSQIGQSWRVVEYIMEKGDSWNKITCGPGMLAGEWKH